MFNYDKLELFDLSAPVNVRVTCSFKEAQTRILEAYSQFDEEFALKAQQFFSNPWIDAEMRENKNLGAFCSPVLPGLHPVLFISYNDTLYDMLVLAHELGHGVHFLFAGERQTLFTYYATGVTAETASIFSTTLLNESLVQQERDNELKKAYLVHDIESFINTCFRQIMYVMFEQEVHRRIVQQQMSSADMSDLWKQYSADLYGPVVMTTPESNHRWILMHFFFTKPFFSYTYSIAHLFAMGLYHLYKNYPKNFSEQYKELLRSGSEFSPIALARKIGIDLTGDEFWNGGFVHLNNLIDKLESLIYN